MRWLLTISFLILLLPVFSQEQPAALAEQLTKSSKTELEKVTAIFRWITDNVSYKVRSSNNQAVIGAASLKNLKDEDDNSPLKSLNERVAETVLKKRVAVCDGYARLFTTLCDFAGIRSEIIVGYARSNSNKPTQRFGVNHYWNAVMIDNSWHLLDATWASGYMSMRGDRFVQEYDDNYFLTSPEIFIRDHYPEDARWTLLPDTKMPEEFRRSPFMQKSFTKYQFTSFYPKSGVIEVFVGDTIRLKLETAIAEAGRNISPGMLTDSSIFTHSPSWVFLNPVKTQKNASPNHSNYIYSVASPDVEWMYLLYNDDVVLRYKVNVKKKKS